MYVGTVRGWRRETTIKKGKSARTRAVPVEARPDELTFIAIGHSYL